MLTLASFIDNINLKGYRLLTSKEYQWLLEFFFNFQINHAEDEKEKTGYFFLRSVLDKKLGNEPEIMQVQI